MQGGLGTNLTCDNECLAPVNGFDSWLVADAAGWRRGKIEFRSTPGMSGELIVARVT